MLKIPISILLFLFSILTACQQKNPGLIDRTVSYSQLKNGFENPPAEAKMRCYWWWLNGMATKESITRDLEEMKAKGIGGALLIDAASGSSSYKVAKKTAAGPVFMSTDWMELYKHAVKEADRLDIELSVNILSGWNLGGPFITPEMAMKKIVWSEVDIVGGNKVSIDLPQPEVNLMYKDVLVQAIPKKTGTIVQNEAIKNWKKKTFNERIGWKGVYPLDELLRKEFSGSGEEFAVKKDEIIDLTGNFRNGQLEWDAPSGEWTIIRYGYTCTGIRTSTSSDGWEGGLSLDHLNSKAFGIFSDSIISPLIETAQSVGNSLKYLHTGSWEIGLVNWTNNFPDEFAKYRNYDIKPYMPILAGRIIENRYESDRFLHDFRKTISDCVADNHFQQFYNIAHKYGLGIHPESGGPHAAPVDALKMLGINDIPMGEFWATANTHRITDGERLFVRQAASAGHTNGKRIVAAEGPTSIGPQWERSPMELKGNLDRILCSGTNRIFWHVFVSSPKEFGLPGIEYFAGTHLNPNVTWWKQSKDFINYLNRSMFMLQQGLFVADVLYYYGDDVPNFVFLKDEIPELNFGYDWDKCSKDVILNRVSVKDGKIILPDGMNYRLMMLDPQKGIDLEVLQKLEKLVKEGMTLIGPKPIETTGLSGFPNSDQVLTKLTDKLWGKIDCKTITENKYGKGRVIWGQDVNHVLSEMDVQPDFQFKGTHPQTSLDYIHRTIDNHDIYFVSNRFSQMGLNDFEYRYLSNLPDRWERVECSFRVSGKVPEIWDPITGQMEEVVVFREENGRTIIPLLFEPEGSKFIVFRNAEQPAHITEIRKDSQLLFPESIFKTTNFPYIDFKNSSKGVTSEIFVPGDYSLSWSDGFSEEIKYKENAHPIELNGEWEVQFDTNWGAPSTTKTDTLKSWTEFDNKNIKYYSGTATYLKSFDISPSDLSQYRLILDLGNVKEMASIKINGNQMQVKWSAPFRFDLSPYLKEGLNSLEVEVVNMWVNRLVGDSKLPIVKRYTRTNITKFDVPDSEKYLRVSGLMGPVKIVKAKRIVLQNN